MKAIIMVVVIVVLALIGWAIYRTTRPVPTPAPGSTSTANPPVSLNTVMMKNQAFSPANLTVQAGEKVTWTNDDLTAHDVTFTDFASGQMAPGQSYEHVFLSAGNFSYHCAIHPSMTGQITVE